MLLGNETCTGIKNTVPQFTVTYEMDSQYETDS